MSSPPLGTRPSSTGHPTVRSPAVDGATSRSVPTQEGRLCATGMGVCVLILGADLSHGRVRKKGNDKGAQHGMRQWILAFNAGCSKCQEIIVGVQAEAPSHLSVRNLTDLDILELRRKAFGPNYPWAPTLLAVDGDHVRGRTGPKLAVRLAVLLGSKRSLRVIRTLKNSAAVLDVAARSRVLRAVPGLATGVFLLSGGTSFAGQHPVPNTRELQDDSAAAVLRHAEQDKDFGRLRSHLESKGYRGYEQHVLEGDRNDKVRRGIRSEFRGSGDSSAHLFYAYEPGEEALLVAVVEEGDNEHMLTVRDGCVVPWEKTLY